MTNNEPAESYKFDTEAGILAEITGRIQPCCPASQFEGFTVHVELEQAGGMNCNTVSGRREICPAARNILNSDTINGRAIFPDCRKINFIPQTEPKF